MPAPISTKKRMAIEYRIRKGKDPTAIARRYGIFRHALVKRRVMEENHARHRPKILGYTDIKLEIIKLIQEAEQEYKKTGAAEYLSWLVYLKALLDRGIEAVRPEGKYSEYGTTNKQNDGVSSFRKTERGRSGEQ
jgi:hypothetical protein